jgi:hypothetical protein
MVYIFILKAEVSKVRPGKSLVLTSAELKDFLPQYFK